MDEAKTLNGVTSIPSNHGVIGDFDKNNMAYWKFRCHSSRVDVKW